MFYGNFFVLNGLILQPISAITGVNWVIEVVWWFLLYAFICIVTYFRGVDLPQIIIAAKEVIIAIKIQFISIRTSWYWFQNLLWIYCFN